MVATPEITAQLYEEYHEKVMHYLVSQVNNLQLAEELCANVFLKVCEKIGTFDETKASVSTWIYTIARNELTDYYRTRRVFAEVSENLPEEGEVDDGMLREEMLDELADALEGLGKQERTVIVLRYYDGWTLKKIAEQLDFSYTYVKTLHSRALAKLQKFFQKNSCLF